MTKISFVAFPVAAALASAGIATAVAHGSAGGGTGTPHHASGAAPAASIAISNCRLPKADFITNDVYNLSTTSKSYVPVPGMTKTITQGGTTPGCVVVNVSGYSYAPNGALEFVSVELDGVQGNPYEVQFSGDDDEDGDGRWAAAHAAVFAFKAVAPGKHTVSMTYNSFGGQEVLIDEPAMTIGHK